jgi:hypothetical protein
MVAILRHVDGPELTWSAVVAGVHESLVKIFGERAAEVFESHVDIRLAAYDTASFERAIAVLLGPLVAKIVADCVLSDIGSSSEKRKPDPIETSGYMEANGHERLLEGPVEQRSSRAVSIYSVRFIETMRVMTALGFRFSDLAKEGLILMLGETCAYATLGSMGRDALESPNLFAQGIVSLFGSGGRIVLNDLILFAQSLS